MSQISIAAHLSFINWFTILINILKIWIWIWNIVKYIEKKMHCCIAGQKVQPELWGLGDRVNGASKCEYGDNISIAIGGEPTLLFQSCVCNCVAYCNLLRALLFHTQSIHAKYCDAEMFQHASLIEHLRFASVDCTLYCRICLCTRRLPDDICGMICPR